MQLKEQHILKPANLDAAYYIYEVGAINHAEVLIVAYTGQYPSGSTGDAYGRYISIMAMQGVVAFDPCSLVLDLRELEFSAGNALFEVFQSVSRYMNEPGEMPFPIVVVTSEKCRAAFLALVTPEGGKPPAWHFEQMPEALQAAHEAAHAWLDS